MSVWFFSQLVGERGRGFKVERVCFPNIFGDKLNILDELNIAREPPW